MVYSTKREVYIFNREKFEPVQPEFMGLLEMNHRETGVPGEEFDPDFDRYFYLERTSSLAFFTIRTEELMLPVGYNMFYLDEQINHRGIKCATQANVYIDKAHRGIGLSFLKFCDDSLKESGVRAIWRQATAKLDIGQIYERMGYQFIEKSYLKRF